MSKDGIILVNKDKDFTSRDVVNKACKILGTKKIGHCGTLDPFATGVLILGINKGTKLLQFLEGSKKRYIAKLKLGVLTDTLDVTGTVIENKPVPTLTREKIVEVLNSFLGASKQKTPKYSARKINGKKLYEYARENIEIEDIYRDIEIYSINLMVSDEDSIIFLAEVSKGTYIRQLGADIAEKLGTVGILEELTRISIGDFLIGNALKIDEVCYEKVVDYNTCLDFMPSLKVYGDLLKKIRNGMTVKLDTKEPRILIKDGISNEIVAIYEPAKNGYYKCFRGL